MNLSNVSQSNAALTHVMRVRMRSSAVYQDVHTWILVLDECSF
jgi:hypothetical protein